ncbi:apolipoprotein N-acyltransferase [Prochlorococcus marinus]|uniref:apolipoprotein N-acyltransferase n=1 Tax=Prochlorococcus marinus TaxID=1219 RepID=UPI0022B2CEC0|nr:apolipoprotein N-acyltransferase [Prochlorococcus marinus]
MFFPCNKSRYKYFIWAIGALGGFFAGFALSQSGFIFIFLALPLLWEAKQFPVAGFLWGFVSILLSHRWLLSLHPLTWLGVPELFSLPIAILLWLSCGVFGGALVYLWCLVGKITFFEKAWKSSLKQQVLTAFILSALWGLVEVILAKTPFFWIGIGESLLQGDRWLVGLARWFGEGGLATLELFLGWWLWRVGYVFRKRLAWKKFFFLGVAFLLFVHAVGWSLLVESDFSSTKRIALWQTNIPIRKKFSREFLLNLPGSLQDALSQSEKLGAEIMVAPEGTLQLGQKLLSPSQVSLLSGGFRVVKDKQRSSLLVFNKGEYSYSEAIDKYRLVPLGEKVPSFPGFIFRGLSFVGGIYPGEASRLLKWEEGPSVAVAICYELSDGNALAKATMNGAEWILSIANLDPYPMLLQKQFLAMAQIRSIESARDLISVANTGPSSLILSNGKITSVIEPFVKGIDTIDIHLSNKISGYVRWSDLPLFVSFLTAIFFLLSFSIKNQFSD